MACKGCGEADGHHKPGCGFSPTVLQITNKDCTLFHNVTIPAIMGDETEVPPTNGLYKNVLLYYEASGNAYFYSSDGIPTKLTYATTDYNALTNKPTINGVTLEGNQSSSSLGININDATLTLKQGDTTLGTFSANASENVEINVGGNGPTAFTMQYDVSDVSAMPGWQSIGLKEKIGETYGTPVEFYKTTYAYYGTNAQHPVTFLNEETGDVITPAELYSLLNDGEDVIINHVPIVRAASEWGNSAAYIDSVHLTKVVEPAPPYDSISFCGSAYTTVSVPNGDDWEAVQTQLGFSIEGWMEDDSLEYDRMTVRGVEQGS